MEGGVWMRVADFWGNELKETGGGDGGICGGHDVSKLVNILRMFYYLTYFTRCGNGVVGTGTWLRGM